MQVSFSGVNAGPKKPRPRIEKSVLFIGLFLSLWLPSLPAMAQGGKIQLGNLKIIPGIVLNELYNDNIFLGNGRNDVDELVESDWITHFMPSLLLDYTLQGRGNVSIGYQGDLAFYGEREENNWQTHKGFFSTNYNAPGGLILEISETYTDAEDPYGTDTEFGLGEPRTKRWNNDLKTKVGFLLGGRFKILGLYNYYKQDFESADDFTQDYDVSEFGVGLNARFYPKTWAFLRYHYGEQDFFSQSPSTGLVEANDADTTWHRLNLGMIWDSGAKLTGELNFGYQWREHDNVTDPNGDLYDNRDTWIASTSLSFLPTSTTTLALNITRAIRTTGAASREFLEDTAVGLNLQQTILTKFTLSAGVQYTTQQYNLPEASPREDDNILATVGLDFKMKDWLKAGLSYSYNQKKSNALGNEFDNNQLVASLNVIY